jgi:hypothetical protein
MEHKEQINKGKMYYFVENIKGYFRNKKNKMIDFFVRNKKTFIFLTLTALFTLYFIRVLFIPGNIWIRTHAFEIITFIIFTFIWFKLLYKTFTVVGKMKKSKYFLVSFIPLLVSVVTVFFTFFSTDKSPFQVARYIAAHDSIQKVAINDLPKTEFKYIRAMPNEAVLPILRDKMKDSDKTINHVELSYDYITDDFLWLGEITPIGNYNKIISDVLGIYGMSATKVNLKPITFDGNFKYGQRLTWFNDIIYNINKVRPIIDIFDSELDDNIRAFRIAENEQVRIVSVIDYEGFFGIPKFGGVYIIHENNGEYKEIGMVERELGFIYSFLEKQYNNIMDKNDTVKNKISEIEFVSVENIKNYPFLKNQNLVPEEVTEFYAKSWSYRNGITNLYIDKKGLTKITKLPGEKNKQPFNLYYDAFETSEGPEKAGIYQLYILEPKGSNKGVSTALLFDSSGYTNDIRVFEVDFSKTDYNLVGPEAVEQPIVAHFPNMAWDKFIITESKLVTFDINDKTHYYYLNSIISTGDTSFSKPLTILVNAQTLEIKSFGMEYTYKKLEDYLDSKKIFEKVTIPVKEEVIIEDKIIEPLSVKKIVVPKVVITPVETVMDKSKDSNKIEDMEKHIAELQRKLKREQLKEQLRKLDEEEAISKKLNIEDNSTSIKQLPILIEMEDENVTILPAMITGSNINKKKDTNITVKK